MSGNLLLAVEQPLANNPDDPVRRYFGTRYPGRSNLLARPFFRAGEQQRIDIVGAWLQQLAPDTLLDAGCGDGVFLERILPGRMRLLSLEDFVPEVLAAAHERHQSSAETVRAHPDDVRISRDEAHYDVVLALGIFDYERDWVGLLRNLLRRTRGTLIVDFPKMHGLRGRLRRAWLALHGIALHTADNDELEDLFRDHAIERDRIELPDQRIVRLTPLPPGRRNDEL